MKFVFKKNKMYLLTEQFLNDPSKNVKIVLSKYIAPPSSLLPQLENVLFTNSDIPPSKLNKYHTKN
jgi:hypothetical protein